MADPGRMSKAADVARTINPLSFAARQFSGGVSPAAEDQATREAVDHIQQIIDIAGIVDQTGIADVSNMLVSLMRAVEEPGHRWEHLKHAALSSIGAIPVFGDVAKLSKKYRGTAHGIAAAETISEVAKAEKTREVLSTSAGWVKAHPGAIAAMVHRASHLLQILVRARKGEDTRTRTTVDVLEELRGAYADIVTDVGIAAVGGRVADEQMARMHAKAEKEEEEREARKLAEEDEDEDEEIESAASSFPDAPASGVGTASGTAASVRGTPVAPGASGAPQPSWGRVAAYAGAVVATGGSLLWWRRHKARKARDQKARESGAAYTVRLPDGTVRYFPAAAEGSAAVFATRPGGEGTRVFWGSPQQTQGMAQGSEAHTDQRAAGEGTGPVTIEPPQGPGWFRRGAGALGRGFMHLPGPAMTWAMWQGAGQAWMAGNRAVTSIWRAPGRVARKGIRTGAQLGIIGGPLGMYLSGGPKALIEENKGLVRGTRDVIKNFTDLVNATQMAGHALMNMQDHLIQYSGAMASAKAQFIVDQIRRDMQLAQSTGGSYAFMLRQQSGLADETVKYRAFAQNLSNLINGVTAWAEKWAVKIFEELSPLDELINLFNNIFGGGWQDADVVKTMRNIADGIYTQPRRPRRPPSG